MKELAPFSHLLEGFSDTQLRDFLCYLLVMELEHGEELISEGNHTESLYLVSEGQLTIHVGQEKEIEITKIQPGGWVGEVSMLDPGPASATVRVFVRAKLLELTHDSLQKMLEDHPEAAFGFLHGLSCSLANRLHFTSQAVIRKDQWKMKLAPGNPGHPPWVTDSLKSLNDTSP